MDLFSSNSPVTILPYDGEAVYYRSILSHESVQTFFDALMNNIAWQNDEAIIFGKHYITKRKAAWHGDANYAYTYSNTTKKALPWTNELVQLKKIVEHKAELTFNSCLLNLYHNGDEGMAWHSDDEQSLGINTTIASLSLGAERIFSFKHKATKEKTSITLENGSLLIMKGTTQTHWLHSLPKAKKITKPRINLTFRTIVTP